MVAIIYGRTAYEPHKVTAFTCRTGYDDDPVLYVGIALDEVLGCRIVRTMSDARAWIRQQEEAGAIDKYAHHFDRRA